MNIMQYRQSSINSTLVMKALSCAQPSDPGKKERKNWKKNGRKKTTRTE